MEIDWSVGQILSALKKFDLADNTLVLFTSDNGPWLSYGNHAGSAHPLREGKGTTWEGGQRVPCIVRWPRRIPAGQACHTPAMHIDLFPTIQNIVGGTEPPHQIDGRDITALLTDPAKAKSPHEAYFFYRGDRLEAVRSEKWSLHLNHSYRSLKDQPGQDGIPGPYIQKQTEVSLYDLENDLSQKRNIAEDHPRIVNRLRDLAKRFDASLRANKRPRGSL